MMKKFEYKIVTLELESKYKTNIDIVGSEAVLTGEGLEGWEAVSSFQDTDSYGRLRTHILMKREIIQ